MRAFTLLAATIAALSSAAVSRADFIVGTTFDSDRQNWSATFPSNTGTLTLWQSSGGNPGGALRSDDRTSSSGFPPWFFENTTTFNGNRSTAYNGSLSFDLKSSGTGALKNLASFPSLSYDVRLGGNIGVNTVYLVYRNLTAPQGNVWNSYSLTLNEAAGWLVYNAATNPSTWVTPTQAQFQGVLANVQNLQIRGDFSAADESTWLDNVALASPAPAAAPEPGSLTLASLVGLGWAGAAARRRRKTTAAARE